MSIKIIPFGILRDGRTVNSYLLSNGSISVKLMNYGATVLSINVPDRNGNADDVVCGYDAVSSYENADGYQGAVIGRVANRIGGAAFNIGEETYRLYKNDGENTLHGGRYGFNSKLWNVLQAGDNEIKFDYLSRDGEEGFPGDVHVTVSYRINGCALEINYKATASEDTPINLTNHSYFNLSGVGGGSILSHTLKIDAESYLVTDKDLIPTGEIKPVDGTPFDFRNEKEIGRDFGAEDADLKIAGGYDHCLNFTGGATEKPECRAELYDKKSGRVMRVYTDMPSVQLYTGNFMKNKSFPFKGGIEQNSQNAVCLETQFMPDSINKENFNGIILRPGETYDRTTVYGFSVR